MGQQKNKVLIVGGGLGGLAAGIRLQAGGYSVEIWEKNENFGGKLQEHRAAGFRWDTGPSLLTMPHVLEELFQAAGRKLTDYLTLSQLANTCRYFWPDGVVLDENGDFWRRPEVQRFLEYAQGIYALSGKAYLHHPPEDFWKAFNLDSLPQLRHLPKVATTETLAKKVDKFFTDPHLRQLFYRFATYNGSSPFRTPSTFNIIPYVEQHFGAWYPQGGLASIARALTTLAAEVGIKLSPNTQAIDFQDGEVRSKDGQTRQPDYLICNQDVLTAAQTWLTRTYRRHEVRQLLQVPLSSSGFVLFLGVSRQYPQLSHHNIFFTENYREEFAQIFDQQKLPSDPTIYIAISGRSDVGQAPLGQDNFFVLINSPALPPGRLSSQEVTGYSQKVIQHLEKRGLTGLSESLVYQRAFTCDDFAHRDLTHQGSLYGWASHSIRAALFRPPIRHPRIKNLFFVGGTTHPGGGIPLVLLSGQMVAEKIQKKAGLAMENV